MSASLRAVVKVTLTVKIVSAEVGECLVQALLNPGVVCDPHFARELNESHVS